MTEVVGTATEIRYIADCIDPSKHLEGYHYSIYVRMRGNGDGHVYGVYNSMGDCLSLLTGEWDYEPLPSSREDDWLEDHRTDLDTAIELAQRHALIVTPVGNMTAEQYVEWWNKK